VVAIGTQTQKVTTANTLGQNNALKKIRVPILLEHYDENENVCYIARGSNWMAQTFTPGYDSIPVDFTMNYVQLKLQKGLFDYGPGTPMEPLGPVLVSIRQNISGPDLVWTCIDGDQLPSEENWVNVSFSPICCHVGTTYSIIIRAPNPLYSTIVWCGDSYSDTYQGGQRLISPDNGHTWTTDQWSPASDFLFRIYGTPLPVSSIAN
jgi:hypothetical protein